MVPNVCAKGSVGNGTGTGPADRADYCLRGTDSGRKQFGDTCFRFSSHGSWLHRNVDDAIGAEDMALILMDERGSRKGVNGRYYRVLLNQADTEKEQRLAEKIAGMLPLNLQTGCVRTTRTR